MNNIKYCLDTSAWLEFFNGNEELKKIIDERDLITPIIVIAELSSIFAKKNIDFEKFFNFILGNSVIVNLNLKSCLESGLLKEKQRKKNKTSSFSLTDSLIYLTSIENNAILISKDFDFEGLEKVKIIK
ncbi:MAG: PIN domain-containing protein [Candidatus Woesearchaeota archaeon]